MPYTATIKFLFISRDDFFIYSLNNIVFTKRTNGKKLCGGGQVKGTMLESTGWFVDLNTDVTNDKITQYWIIWQAGNLQNLITEKTDP